MLLHGLHPNPIGTNVNRQRSSAARTGGAEVRRRSGLCQPRCVGRRALVAVVVAVLASGLGVVPAAAQDDTSAPPTEEELAEFATRFTCPVLAGFDNEEPFARVNGEDWVVECGYSVDDRVENNMYVRAVIQPPGTQRPSICSQGTYTSDNEEYANVLGQVRADDVAAVAEFNYIRSRTPELGNADFETAAADLAAQAAPFADACPPELHCSPTAGSLATTFDTNADAGAGDDHWIAGCWYSPGSEGSTVPDGESQLWSDVVMDVFWATDAQNGGMTTTICSAEPLDRYGTVVIPHPEGLAVMAEIDFRAPQKKYERDAMVAEAERLMAEVAPLARSCDGVEVIRPSDYYTPLPAWLELDESLAVGAAPSDIDVSGSGDSLPELTETGAFDLTQPVEPPRGGAGPSSPGGDGTGSSVATALRILGIVMLIVSVLAVLLSLLLMGRESKLRPRFDVIRVVIMIAVVAVMTLLFTTRTPLWAAAAAVLAGLLLGFTQGRNLTVRATDKGLYAKRTAIAMVAFVAGLAVTQIAGLANRTGAIQFGLALSVLSVTTAIGLMVGRQPAVGAARRVGAAAVIVILAAPAVVALAVDTAEPAHAQDDPTDEATDPAAVFTSMLDWDTTTLVGGFESGPDKPAIDFPILDAYSTPPADLVVDLTWERGDADALFAFDIQETYSFALNASGVCCDVTYAVTGTETYTFADNEPRVTDVVGAPTTITDLVIGGANRGPMPFGQAQIADDGACSRTVIGSADDLAFVEFGTFTEDGEDGYGQFRAPQVQVGCDIDGFTVADALAAAPPTPEADAPERAGGFYQTQPGCPVYQEVVGAMYDPAFEEGKLNPDQLGTLFLTPNAPACDGSVHLGGDERGARRSELDYALATTDPLAEGHRLWDSQDSFMGEFPLHEIPEERRCAVDATTGIPENRPDQEWCNHRSYHKVADGEITIWTDTAVADGPNTFIRAVFPWGSYRYRCHHCVIGDPEVARALDRFHEMASRGVGGYGAGDVVIEEVGSTGAPAAEDAETAAPAATDDIVDLFADEDATDEERAAIATALVGLIGAAGIAGISMLESGNSLADVLDAVRRGDLNGLRPGDPPAEPDWSALFGDPDAAEAFAERLRQTGHALPPGVVIDENGEPMFAGEDGRFDWGGAMLSREDVLERIADQRQANAERDARIEELIAAGYDEEEARRRTEEMTQRSRDDDAQAREELEDMLEHAAAQDRTRQRVADMLQERAETGGWDAIADRLEQGDSLTTEELQELREVLDILTREQGAVDPETTGTYAEDLWNEFAADAATAQEALAQVLERTHGPMAAWIARNPGTTARIGLGIATGGFSEGVIAPHEMMAAMEAAAERAHAEGRDLTYGEAMAAAAWHAGPGMLIGKVAEVGMSALGPAVSRWAADAWDSMGRSVDDWVDGMRGVTRQDGADVFAESLARQRAPHVPSVRNSAAMSTEHGLHWNPRQTVGGALDAPPGTVVPQSRMAADWGISNDGYRQLRGAAQRHDVGIQVRSRSQAAIARLEAGAVPKPEAIKIKTGSELDTYIGLDADRVDLVAWKPDGDWVPPTRGTPPKNWPEGKVWDDDAFNAVNGRYQQRMDEFANNQSGVQDLIDSGRARMNTETNTLEWNVTGGRRGDPGDFKPIAGDHDLFDITVNVPPDIPADQVDDYIRAVQADVLQDLSGPPMNVQHGAHVQWNVPSTQKAQEINVRILEGHREGAGDALLTVSKDMPAHVSYYNGTNLTLDDVRRVRWGL